MGTSVTDAQREYKNWSSLNPGFRCVWDPESNQHINIPLTEAWVRSFRFPENQEFINKIEIDRYWIFQRCSGIPKAK